MFTGLLHEIALDDREVGAGYSGFNTFTLLGNNGNETRGVIRAAVRFWNLDRLTASLGYSGEFGSTRSSHSLAAGTTYRF